MFAGLQRIEEHDAGALYVEQLILSAGNRLKAPLDKVPKHGLHPGASVVVARNHANGHRKPRKNVLHDAIGIFVAVAADVARDDDGIDLSAACTSQGRIDSRSPAESQRPKASLPRGST